MRIYFAEVKRSIKRSPLFIAFMLTPFIAQAQSLSDNGGYVFLLLIPLFLIALFFFLKFLASKDTGKTSPSSASGTSRTPPKKNRRKKKSGRKRH